MVALALQSPHDICQAVASRARAARLAADLTQEGLAERAGVSLGTLKRFERTGAGSLDVLARIAMTLRLDGGFDALFVLPKFRTLDEVIATPRTRVRGRRR